MDIRQDSEMSEDQDEILRVSDELSRMGLYGAAQMVCRLARQRDEVRYEALEDAAKYLKGRGLSVEAYALRRMADKPPQ
jgi:hypothetical protein